MSSSASKLRPPQRDWDTSARQRQHNNIIADGIALELRSQLGSGFSSIDKRLIRFVKHRNPPRSERNVQIAESRPSRVPKASAGPETAANHDWIGSRDRPPAGG